MKQELLNFNLFLASPSDVAEERVIVKEVVDELNIGFCFINNCNISLITWEDKSIPEIGAEPQKIINSQLLNSYEIDILVGLFWHRIGSRTSTHISGTVEEISSLIEKNEIRKTDADIMIYFKSSAPNTLSEIDPEQLLSLREYKKEIGKIGLYREYNHLTELAKFLRIHLIGVINKKLKKKDKCFFCEYRLSKRNKYCPNCHIEKIDYDSLNRILNKHFKGKELFNFFFNEVWYVIENLNWKDIKETLASPFAGIMNTILQYTEEKMDKTLFVVFLVIFYLCLNAGIIIFSFVGPILILGLLSLLIYLVSSGIIVFIVILYLIIRTAFKQRMIQRICKKWVNNDLDTIRFKPLIAELEHRAKRHLTSDDDGHSS